MKLARSAVASVAAVGLIGLGAVPATADDHLLVDNVFSPLAFSIGDDGTVYVSESFIGQLTAVSKKGVRTTLASLEGGFMGGVEATGKGTLTYTVSAPPEFEEGPPTDTSIHRVTPNGKDSMLASLLAYEEANNPDAGNTYGFVDADAACQAQIPDFIGPPYPGIVESNPYAVAIAPDGHRLVADAAANAIVGVSPNGKSLRTVAVLPPIAQGPVDDDLADEFGLPDCVIGLNYMSEPVPTDVEVGPDGDFYVSALPGGPELPGFGTVFRIDHNSGAVSEVATGFSGATDLAVADDGTIYVAELFGFQVSKVDPGDNSPGDTAFVECPSAVEIGPDGHLYVAEAGICTDGPPSPGRIVRLDL